MALPPPSRDATVVVTGASAGIGEQLARELARRGHGVTLVARREETLAALAGELDVAHGVRADVHACDLGDAAARRVLIDTLLAGDRAVAGLCNNAGFGAFGRFHRLPLEREVEMVRLNVEAVVELAGAFLPGMVDRGAGAVLNVASTAASQPLPGNATYAATKAFVLSHSEATAAELAGTGVSVTALCPGPVKTEFADRAGVGDVESDLPGFVWVSARRVAQAGVDGMESGARVVTPGVGNKLSAFGGRYVPRAALLPAVRTVMRRRVGDRG